MTANSEVLDRKIADARLRAFADSTSDGVRSILVEIEAEDPVVVMSSKYDTAPGEVRVVEAREAKDGGASEERARRSTSALLASMGLKHRFLRSARVFVVETSPKQLRRIAKSPSVRSVVPNREVKL